MKGWKGICLVILALLFLAILPSFLNATPKSNLVFNTVADYWLGDKDIAGKIEDHNILFVNLKDGPAWDEKWQEIAKISFTAIPIDLKNLITQRKPLIMGLKREIEGLTIANYDSNTNTISLDFKDLKKPPWYNGIKNELTIGTIIHEAGHAVDAHKRWGKNNWRRFLELNPAVAASLREIYEPDKRDYVAEGFADSFRYYIVLGVLPQSPYSFFREDNQDFLKVRYWMKENVFRGEEPNREILREFLSKGE